MAITTNRACVAWLARSRAHFDVRGLGVVLALTALFACLMCAELGSESSMLSLQELERAETTLMSCDKQSTGTGAHLWCEAPDSPLCLPALPASGHVELWDHAPYALFVEPEPAAQIGVWVTWTRPEASARPRSRASARLERPPRA